MFIAKTIKTEIITVTPELAEELLARNTKNRRPSPANLLKVKEAMSAGEWELNGEAIKVATDGTILDGQHRLMACVELGIPFKTLIVYGLPNEAQDTMDTGKARTIAGVLSLHGVPNASKVAAVTAAVIRVEKWGIRAALSNGSNKYAVTAKQVLARVEAEPELLELPNAVRSVASITGGVATPATLLYVFSGIDAEDAEFFFRKLGNGEGLAAGNPILALRNQLISMNGDVRGERSQRYVSALFIKAWNKYRSGDEIQQLRFRLGGANPEAFPEPK